MSSEYLGYGRQSISEDDIQAVSDVLRSPNLTQGPAVEQFESDLAVYLGSSHALAVSSGTAALHLVLLAAEVAAGDAVIVPAITFAATANAALYCGATPVFADIDPVTYCLSPESAEAAVELALSRNLRPRVLAPVHFSGMPADLAALRRLADKYDMLLMEDACHALGARATASTGELVCVGDDRVSHVAVWSFHPVKHITTGEGGAVTTSDAKLASRVRMLRSHGITRDQDSLVNRHRAHDPSGRPNRWYHEMQLLGFNYRLPDLNAALGSSQLRRIESFVDRRRDIASFYRTNLSSYDGLFMPYEGPEGVRHSYHLFPLQVDFEALGETREQFMARLERFGIGSQVHYLPVFWHPFYEKNPDRWLSVECRESLNFYERELSVPIFPEMDQEDCERVVAALTEATRRRS